MSTSNKYKELTSNSPTNYESHNSELQSTALKRIVIENLNFTYKGSKKGSKKETIKNMSFSINGGEIFGLLGPSGAGKTTVLKILVGLLKNYKGKIQILSRELREWDSTLYNQIGVSPEQPNHFLKLTALENIKYFATLYQVNPNFTELFQMVNLEEDMNKLVSDYSKGMQMRLNLLRAILHNPNILFLDEPTNGLDPIHARHIKDLILKFKANGKTIFLTTHNMDLAQELCDRVCIINNGEIKSILNPKNIHGKISGKKQVSFSFINSKEQIENQIFSLENLLDDPEAVMLLKSQKLVRIETIEPSLEDLFIELANEVR